jgi:hypothetical protein
MSNEQYYLGMAAGINRCCKLMTMCVKEVTTKQGIEAKYYVARTAEAMSRLAKRSEELMKEVKGDN